MKSSHGSDSNTIDGVPRRRIVLASMVGTTIEFYEAFATRDSRTVSRRNGRA